MVATARPFKLVIDPNAYGDPKSPPDDIYTLELMRVASYGLGKPFEGEEPKPQFTLEFKLEYPFDESDVEEKDRVDGMIIKSWYTPKFRAIPGKPVPKLFTLLEVLNGGSYEQPEEEFDGWEEIERFCAQVAQNVKQENDGMIVGTDYTSRPEGGTKIRCRVGPGKTGWARMQGDPMPPVKERKAKITARVIEPDDDEDVDENF